MFKRILAFVFIAILISNELVSVAQAEPNFDETFYSGNDILFYDPRCDTGVAEGLISLKGKDALEKILKFLIDPARGLTLQQAAGVIGNLMAESQLDPSIIQGGGHATPDYKPENKKGFGLAQWTFTSRQQPLYDFIQKNVPNKDITDLDGQVNFMWHELTGTHADALRELKTTTTPLDAAYVFHKYYEGSADSMDRVKQVRGGNAQKVYDQYKDADALAGSTATGTDGKPTINSTSTVAKNVGRSCLPTAAGGDLIELVKQYAWPEYKGLTTTPTDAYKDAVQQAISQKRYVGGTAYPGIDCGGFVTTLIVDSGFDKEYNNGSFSGRGAGNTIAQEAWLKKNWRRISDTDATDRQPGDVAINETHTYIFVGPDAFPNHMPIASASWDERAPMQGTESVVSRPHSGFRWYRKAATMPPITNPGGGGGTW